MNFSEILIIINISVSVFSLVGLYVKISERLTKVETKVDMFFQFNKKNMED